MRTDILLPEMATLVEVRPMTAQEKLFRLRVTAGGMERHLPGQFLEVSVPGFGEAPISISSSPTRTPPGEIEMAIRRVGRVTGALHSLEPGGTVGLRGPFGTHFPVETALKRRDLLFICGGIGVVPMRSAIQYVLDSRDDYGEISILYGTRRPADRLFTDELDEWQRRDDVTFLETVDAADASWDGIVGVITDLFPRLDVDPARTTALICGPPIMYKFVLLELHERGLADAQTYVSLERRMKCGVGKCGHCQIGPLYACQDGPVFRYSDIRKVREAI